MKTTQTKAAKKVAARIASYKENPVRKTKRVAAVRASAKRKAAKRKVPKRKAPKVKALRKTPRLPKKSRKTGRRGASMGARNIQLRKQAEAQARAALLAEYGTDDPNKVAEIIKQRQAASGAARAKKGATMAAAKKRRKKSRRKTTKRKTARRRTTATATATVSVPRKRRRKTKRKTTKRRRARAAAPATKRRTTKRRRKRPKTRRSTSGPTINIKFPGAPRVAGVSVQTKRRAKKRRSGGRRRSNPVSLASYRSNPYGGRGGVAYSGLFENPTGPFSTASLGAFAVASGGLAIGLAGSRLVDRLIATRTPMAIEGSTATPRNPWYGRNAALATLRRPDMVRVGAQLGLAAAGIGAAYLSRNMTILPWLAGGMALGAMTNVFLMGIEYYLMPAIFKVEASEATAASTGNRLYPFEQAYVQDGVDAAFEKWNSYTQLNANQAETPVVMSPLVSDTSQIKETPPVVALGNAQREIARLQQQLSQIAAQGASLAGGNRSPFDGAAANAGSRAGVGGCGGGCSDTPAGCVDCNEKNGVPQMCRYTVQPGDNLPSLIAATGYSISDINEMNGGLSMDQYWVPGSRVVLPRSVCQTLIDQGAPGQDSTTLFPSPMEFQQDSPLLETVPGLPGTTLYDLRGFSPDPTVFDRSRAKREEEEEV